MPIPNKLGGRPLLIAGFGSLLLLMLVAGVYALVTVERVRTSDAEERDAYLSRNRALEKVRAGIYQSGTAVRDYLLATDPAAAGEREHWSEIRTRTDGALAEVEAVIDPSEAEPFRKLQTEVQVYWKQLEFIFDIPFNDKQLRGSRYLSSEVVRHRMAALDLVDHVDGLITRQMAASDVRLAATFAGLRRRLTIMLSVAVGVGLLLAAFTIWRTLRLENEVEQRYREVKDLSARLVSAQEEERRTISRELHDEVGQSLSALLMEAGNAAAMVPPEALDVRQHVDSIKKLAEASVSIIRNMTLLLRPSMLDDFGLVPALEWHARELSKRTGMRVHVAAADSAGELPDALKTCIYRVVQEALHNCARHAQAKIVRVVVSQEQSKIVLSVEDDGRGFDAGRVRGLGLVGMEERVRHLGGEFQVRSQPGAGTKVAVELPIAS